MVHHLRRSALRVVAALAVAQVAPAHAHRVGGQAYLHWQAEPWLLVLLGASILLYAIGLARLWRSAGRVAGISAGHASAFVAGWLVLTLALCSPLDELASQVFSAHMVQHELLMVLAAPLLVLGRPLAVWLWAMPEATRAAWRDATHARAVQRPWHALTSPFGAFAVHAAAIWIWHVPALFSAALVHEPVHVLQHTSFLFSALLFWWALIGPVQSAARGGMAVLYLFATMMHTGALGALLTLSTSVWYGTNETGTGAWGLTPMEDQQLGGLIMWIPAGTVYVIAALVLMARWIAASGRPSSTSARPSARAI